MGRCRARPRASAADRSGARGATVLVAQRVEWDRGRGIPSGRRGRAADRTAGAVSRTTSGWDRNPGATPALPSPKSKQRHYLQKAAVENESQWVADRAQSAPAAAMRWGIPAIRKAF